MATELGSLGWRWQLGSASSGIVGVEAMRPWAATRDPLVVWATTLLVGGRTYELAHVQMACD
jgi:hypothetical protein